MIYLDDGDVVLHQGDAIHVMRDFPDDSVDCVITSPPYFGLRDYGVEGQIGLEETMYDFLDTLVEVFEEVRRVLAPYGTCWVNMGDSFAGGGNGARDPERWPKQARNRGGERVNHRKRTGIPDKNQLLIPERMSIAFQEAGWWVRKRIIWHKPNPMPESAKDRPTSAHEMIYMLTKSPTYWYDHLAVRQPHAPKSLTHRGGGRMAGKEGQQDGSGKVASGNWGATGGVRRIDPNGVQLRDVWTIAPQQRPEAHFATFPDELVRRCVLAGCPSEVCSECGTPVPPEGSDDRLCKHFLEYVRPGIVLDPFVGSGTTVDVARRYGRHGIGIDLNPEYLEIAAKRTAQQALL